MEPTLPKKLETLLSDYRALPDQDARAEFLIDLADSFREVPPEIATRPFAKSDQVPSCESEAYAWIVKQSDGTAKFHFAVENPQGISAKAWAVILSEALDGAKLPEIQAVSEDLVLEIFGPGISMGKGVGLRSMVGMVKFLAARVLP